MLYVSLLYAGISSIDGQHNTVDISCLVGSKEEYERQLEADNLETEFNAEAQPEEPAEL